MRPRGRDESPPSSPRGKARGTETTVLEERRANPPDQHGTSKRECRDTETVSIRPKPHEPAREFLQRGTARPIGPSSCANLRDLPCRDRPRAMLFCIEATSPTHISPKLIVCQKRCSRRRYVFDNSWVSEDPGPSLLDNVEVILRSSRRNNRATTRHVFPDLKGRAREERGLNTKRHIERPDIGGHRRIRNFANETNMVLNPEKCG